MELVKELETIADFRVQGRCLHKLSDILGLVLCGVIADSDDFGEIEDYGKSRIEFLRETLGFSFLNGIPSEDTLWRVMRHLESKELEKCLQGSLKAFILKGKHLSIDGKELRGTCPEGKKHALVQMVNVWVEDYKLSFGQVAVEEKSNEIKAIPALIDLVDCQGSLLSIDAIGCQEKIVRKIREKQAHYLIALKANQGGLYEQVQDWMLRNKEQLPVYEQLNKEHGRGEKRKVYVCQDLFFLEEKDKWEDLHTLIMVENTRITGEKVQTATRFYISSLQEASPAYYGSVIRGHWGIENGLHWQLDFTFKEDASRVRKDRGPENLHLMRKFALHLLAQNPEKISLKRKRKKASRDNAFLKNLLNYP